MSEIVQFISHGEYQAQECGNDGGIRNPFHHRLRLHQRFENVSHESTYLDMDMGFTDFYYPFLYSVDGNVTQKAVSVVIEIEHPKDRKTSLDGLDESQYCGIEEFARADIVREVIRGNEAVYCGFP